MLQAKARAAGQTSTAVDLIISQSPHTSSSNKNLDNLCEFWISALGSIWNGGLEARQDGLFVLRFKTPPNCEERWPASKNLFGELSKTQKTEKFDNVWIIGYREFKDPVTDMSLYGTGGQLRRVIYSRYRSAWQNLRFRRVEKTCECFQDVDKGYMSEDYEFSYRLTLKGTRARQLNAFLCSNVSDIILSHLLIF